MFEALRALVGSGGRDEGVREPRDCGTVVGRAERRPRCESPDVATVVVD